jgi:hypothetical protein
VLFVPERDIQDAGFVIPHFGGWPCFHDAEIVRLTLQREKPAACLEGVFHVFNQSHDSTEQRQRNHMLVTIRFEAIEGLRLEDFNLQNVIDDLKVEAVGDSGRRFAVEMPPNNGCDATFSCDSIRVASVEPYTREERIQDGSVYKDDV